MKPSDTNITNFVMLRKNSNHRSNVIKILQSFSDKNLYICMDLILFKIHTDFLIMICQICQNLSLGKTHHDNLFYSIF